MGLVAGVSLAFFIASSNFFARMSSLFDSWNQESANLSSRWRLCSARIFWASDRSTSGPGLTGASCESTAPNTGSTTSFAWQHGHVTCRFSTERFPMKSFYTPSPGRVKALKLRGPLRLEMRARRAHSRKTSFDRPASRRDAMSNTFLTCAYVPVACSKHVSIHILLVHRGGPAIRSLDALGGLRFLPEPPGGPGISVLHRPAPTLFFLRVPVPQNKSHPSLLSDPLTIP